MDRAVLRWGGLAGILGSIVLILVFVVVIVFVGAEAISEPEKLIGKFPEIRAARTVENGLYLLVLVLWVVHFLALYHALRETSLAPALFGSVLGIVGLGVLAAGALPHVAQVRMSDLYHAPGTTPADQTTLALMWQATEGLFEALLIAGLAILPIGLIALGFAMLGTPAFGRGLGGLSLVLGVVGVVAALLALVDPGSPVAAAGVLGLIVFHFVLGWRVYTLSRAPRKR